PRTLSHAFHTSPMPPAPSRSVRMNLPNRAVGGAPSASSGMAGSEPVRGPGGTGDSRTVSCHGLTAPSSGGRPWGSLGTGSGDGALMTLPEYYPIRSSSLTFERFEHLKRMLLGVRHFLPVF